ncbi:MAG TPA: hypothetical protein PLC61_02735 [Chitinophagales bacterium]|nr:hypothetical protein [Chitinophagales bacterium]HMW94305.1 hypothetical protein [Chitinophagales bacterium]HMZ68872.1 hypothetical protein [Chitinophagales bacterium]HMZ95270.1 hypothetical protein [Chitinophagales bacterium]HNB38223.1 hypothetical protein [Chitinophagales bacterium]
MLFFAVQLYAQQGNYNHYLARQFVENKEFEKAAEYYADLFNQADGLQYYKEYYAVLNKIGNKENIEKLIKAAYKKSYNNPIYLIDLGIFYQQQNNRTEAEKIYTKIIKDLPKNKFDILGIANYFEQSNLFEEAKKTYLKGKEILKSPYEFNLQIANLYLYQDNISGMVQAYLDEAPSQADNLEIIENGLLKAINKNDKIKDEIEKSLYQRIGKDKTMLVYQDLLVWLYMQINDFEGAIIQAKSLDILRNENGNNIFVIANAALQQKDYNAAIKGFQYIVQKGNNNPWYYAASLSLINAQKEKITNQTNYTQTDLLKLKVDYLDFINSNADNQMVYNATIDLASLEALYLHNTQDAIELLEELVKNPRLQATTIATAKLNLGDYYIMENNPWDARLLYTQVEKDQKGTALGEEAKFRNARLSYFKGDFEWAQTQLKIIKANTTELISNDAIDLSVFILDNLNTDDTDEILLAFSRANLLEFQNKLDAAKDSFALLLQHASNSSLIDDIYFEQYKIAKKQQKYSEALEYLLKIEKQYPTDILADDAIFYAAELYQNFLNDNLKAQNYYEKIILEYKDSTFVIEARKRYRLLRGDI